MKRNRFACLVSILLLNSVLRSSGQTQPQFIAALGGGNVPPQTIGRYTPWSGDDTYKSGGRGLGSIDQICYTDGKNPMSKEVYLKFRSFKVTYKIWSMFGEPVFDFLLRWDGIIGIGNSYIEEMKAWGVTSERRADVDLLSDLRAYDIDLQERIKKIAPLAVRFIISISNKSFYVDAKTTELGELKFIETGGFNKKGYKAQDDSKAASFLGLSEAVFSIDLPEPAGKWQTYSVPGSPNWTQLPVYFKTVFRYRENPADLFIKDIQIVEIRWPQYELKSIIREQYIRNLAKQTESQMASAGFWDKQPSKANVPPPPISDAQRAEAYKDTQLVSAAKEAQTRYKELSSFTGSLVQAEETGLNQLKLQLAGILRGSTLVLKDASGKELGRLTANPGSDVVAVNVPQKLDTIEVYKDWEFVGSIRHAYKEQSARKGEDLKSFFSGGLYGFKDSAGSIAIPARFKEVRIFSQGLAAVKNSEGLWGYIDVYGYQAVPFLYSNAKEFSEGLAAVREPGGELYGYIDLKNNLVIPYRFIDCGAFSQGFASFKATNTFSRPWTKEKATMLSNWNQIGFINKEGRVTIPAQYDETGDFAADGTVSVSRVVRFGPATERRMEMAPLWAKYRMFAYRESFRIDRQGKIVSEIKVDTDRNAMTIWYE